MLAGLTSCRSVNGSGRGWISCNRDSKVRCAGYSGFFDFVRVDEALLDQVYQHDLSLVDDAQGLVTVIDQLSPASGPAAPSLTIILKQLEELGHQVDERTKLLEGLN